MEHFTGKFWTGTTYVTTAVAMLDFDTFTKAVLFLLSAAFLCLQIRLHLIKIRKEKENK